MSVGFCDVCGSPCVHPDDCAFHYRMICPWCKKSQGYLPCWEEFDGQIKEEMCGPCKGEWLDKMEA